MGDAVGHLLGSIPSALGKLASIGLIVLVIWLFWLVTQDMNMLLEPHDPTCLCKRCIECIRLAREYPPPFSWKGFIAWFVVVNVVMWYLTIGQYSTRWWGLW